MQGSGPDRRGGLRMKGKAAQPWAVTLSRSGRPVPIIPVSTASRDNARRHLAALSFALAGSPSEELLTTSSGTAVSSGTVLALHDSHPTQSSVGLAATPARWAALTPLQEVREGKVLYR